MTRQHQGFHECEVSYGGEADLQQHYDLCEKNPGHTEFIPLRELKVEHLPSHYQDEGVVDWIRALADRTCRVVVRYTSLNRPKYFPGTENPFPFYKNRGKDFMRTGTGWVGGVCMYTEEEDVKCECEECVRPGNQIPKKARGEVHILTVAHLVCDQTESNRSECQFHYDSSDITDLSTLLTLRGLGVFKSDIKRDYCDMKYVTHDGDLLDRLDKMRTRCADLGRKVYNKYSKDEKNESESERDEQCEGNKGENPCVCVSHPHGCSKQVTVGTWTHRETEWKGKFKYYREDVVVDGELTRYNYTTPTCPGSSGAPVFTPVCRKVYIEKLRKWRWKGLSHSHSEGRPGNDNNSAVGWEPIQSPT